MKTKESFAAYRIAWVVVAALCFITLASLCNIILANVYLCWALLSMASIVVLVGWLTVAIKFLIRNRGMNNLLDWSLLLLTMAYIPIFWMIMTSHS